MQFSELYGEALNIELGSSDTTKLFTTVRRKAAINKAQLEFVKRTGCYRRSGSLTMVDDTREYDLESASIISSQDFLRLWDDGVEYAYTSGGNTTYRSGDDFPRRDVSWLNKNQGGWRSASSTTIPQAWYIRQDGGHTYFGLSEPPDLSSGTAIVTLPYVARPVDMSADGDQPFTLSSDALKVLEPWHQGLAHFAASILERLRKNTDAVQMQLTLFAGYVADYLQQQVPPDGETIFLMHDYRAAASRMPLSRAQRDPLIY